MWSQSGGGKMATATVAVTGTPFAGMPPASCSFVHRCHTHIIRPSTEDSVHFASVALNLAGYDSLEMMHTPKSGCMRCGYALEMLQELIFALQACITQPNMHSGPEQLSSDGGNGQDCFKVAYASMHELVVMEASFLPSAPPLRSTPGMCLGVAGTAGCLQCKG